MLAATRNLKTPRFYLAINAQSLYLLEERVHKFDFVKSLQLVDYFADADVPNRYFKFVRNTDHNPAFRSSIQFSNTLA